jgi:hypothetical protein
MFMVGGFPLIALDVKLPLLTQFSPSWLLRSVTKWQTYSTVHGLLLIVCTTESLLLIAWVGRYMTSTEHNAVHEDCVASDQ